MSAGRKQTGQRVRKSGPGRHRWTRGFLAALSITGVVSYACEAARVSRCHVYATRNKDPEFSSNWRDALEIAIDSLEAEARRRALEGDIRRQYDRDGRLIQEEVVHSDALMCLLLKANRPEKYKNRVASEHCGTLAHVHLTLDEFRGHVDDFHHRSYSLLGIPLGEGQRP